MSNKTVEERTKTCACCGVTKSYSDYWKNKSKCDGLNTYCKPCQLDKLKTYMATEKGKRMDKKRHDKWSALSAHKYKARYVAYEAIKKGLIKKLYKCEWCGSSRQIEGHHPDYTKPLEVIWLCIMCHKHEHIRLKSELNKLEGKS